MDTTHCRSPLLKYNVQIGCETSQYKVDHWKGGHIKNKKPERNGLFDNCTKEIMLIWTKRAKRAQRALFLSIFTSRLSCFYLVIKEVLLSTVDSKGIYKEIRDGEITQPTEQKKYVEFFENDNLNWKEIYSYPREHS